MTHSDLQYWEYEDIGQGWVNIYCPVLNDGDTKKDFGVCRKLFQEVKSLESILKEKGFIEGWIACTDLNNSNIMKRLLNLGATPYSIEHKKNEIWFCKYLNGET